MVLKCQLKPEFDYEAKTTKQKAIYLNVVIHFKKYLFAEKIELYCIDSVYKVCADFHTILNAFIINIHICRKNL